jgi:hypothetical protein
MGVYLINVHLTGVHLMGVHLSYCLSRRLRWLPISVLRAAQDFGAVIRCTPEVRLKRIMLMILWTRIGNHCLRKSDSVRALLAQDQAKRRLGAPSLRLL